MTDIGFVGLFNPIFSGLEWETRAEGGEASTLRPPEPQWLPEQYKVPGGRKLKVGDRVRGIMPVGNPVVGTVAEISVEFEESYWEEKLDFEGYRPARAVNADTLLKARPLIYPWVRVAPDPDSGTCDCYFGLEEIIPEE